MELKRRILKVSHKSNLLNHLLNFRDLINPYYTIDDRIPDFEMESNKGEVLLPMEGNIVNKYRAAILAHAFRTRGYKPLLLTHHELGHPVYPENEDKELLNSIWKHKWRKVLSDFNLESYRISDLLSDTYELPDIDYKKSPLSYKGVRIDNIATAATRKYIRGFHVDLENRAHFKIYSKYIESCMKIIDSIRPLLDEKDIVASISHDPMYLNRIYGELVKKNEESARTFGWGHRDRTLWFGNYNNRSPMPQFTDKSILEQRMRKELGTKQRNRINEHMKGRIKGKTSRHYYAEKAEKSLKTDENTVAMFTNLMWDSSLEAEGDLYDTPFEWIKDTIDIFQDQEDKTLIIKTHPAEAMRETNESVKSWIDDNYEEPGDNIVLLKPDTEVSPYKLIEDSDAVIAYNSTAGLEAAYFGTPVIITGDTHYKELGFTYDPETISDYRDLVKNFEELNTDSEMEELAERYCHFLYFSKHIEFPFIKTKSNFKGHELLPAEHSKIEPGNKNFDLIVENTVNNNPIIKN